MPFTKAEQHLQQRKHHQTGLQLKQWTRHWHFKYLLEIPVDVETTLNEELSEEAFKDGINENDVNT